ncbi:hypothetical protein AZI86_16075 [Bdellovibrio bacteriovorus]|uniref:HTH merR-type domain-containing protein n=1 Tax=Bdellovibrio bacteriovorus TaxID=959 RepID=A0A150WHZ7_BDEBC|nr:MerR family transcriptional regulator [Bdellovibrio bacteriovorus]KYG63218.1 hypothetical protein AZI86_16075 [Bdellovibrio bacteriovorus]
MNIQTVEQKTGLTKRMIRHYEDLGLINPGRSENNYRDYSEKDVDQLFFIKAMRDVGFGLEDVAQVLKEGKTEEVLRRHLNNLLLKKRELYTEHKNNFHIIRRILKTNTLIDGLLDKIVSAHTPPLADEQVSSIEDFLNKHHVVHGHIKPLAELAPIAHFGFEEEFKITDTLFMTYRDVFEDVSLPRASIAVCKELYSYFILFSEIHRPSEFHKKVLSQFSQQFKKISSELSTQFEAMSDDVTSLERIFSHFDLAVLIRMENDKKESFELVLPGQPLVVYLSQKEGVAYNQNEWLEK